MANVTNPTAIKFCNERARVAADRMLQFYWFCKALKIYYLANPSLASLIPNDATAIIVDGQAEDGRSQLTGADIQTMVTNINTFIASMEASSNVLLNNYAKISVNPSV